MKILYVNWSPLQRGAEVGGGVNIYTQSIAMAMMRKGHEVYSLSSGLTCTFWGKIKINRTEDFKEIRNYEMINAPNLAPGFFNYSSPEQDLSEAHIEEQFLYFLEDIRPDVIHFNNIEGFSANCIKIAKQYGAKVIYSLHNYHPVCNQIGLLYQNREICYDFKDGVRCLDCITPPPKKSEIKLRKVKYFANHLAKGELVLGGLKFFHIQLQRLRGTFRTAASLLKNREERKNNNISLTDSNTFSQSHEELRLAGLPYKERRAGMIDAINEADCVLAVSDWVNQVYSRMGVDKALLHTSHIGSAIADIAVSHPNISIDKKPNEPLNLVYLGISDPHKGLPFLLDSLYQMDDVVLSKIHFHFYARGYLQLKEALDRLTDKMVRITVHDGYHYSDIPKILANMDVGIVPPIWWDNAPQVVFEMLAMKVPVLGANIGGIPDFVRHMDNGLLFEPGNSVDLIEMLTKLATNPQLVDQFKAAIIQMKTTIEHANELEVFYKKNS